MPEHTEILAAVDFGHVDSESELDLDEKYLRTADFERFVGSSRTDLVLGAKGAGKTALFQLFDRHETTVRQWAGDELDHVVIQTANGMRDLSNLAGGDSHVSFSETTWISSVCGRRISAGKRRQPSRSPTCTPQDGLSTFSVPTAYDATGG
jgi:hypothetical protein